MREAPWCHCIGSVSCDIENFAGNFDHNNKLPGQMATKQTKKQEGSRKI